MSRSKTLYDSIFFYAGAFTAYKTGIAKRVDDVIALIVFLRGLNDRLRGLETFFSVHFVTFNENFH